MVLNLSTTLLRRAAEEAASDLPALMARAERAVAGMLQGEHAQRKPGTGERFWQFREYVPGDRPQDIDWRQSAKGDRTYIKQKERQTTQTALFWCGGGAGMDFSSSKKFASKAVEAKTLTLALAILMTRAGEQVGILGGGRTGRTELSLQRIGDSLINDDASFGELPDTEGAMLPMNCSLIQIGDFLSPLEEIEETFKSLSPRASSGLVIQVLDPAEIELPYSGRVLFEAPTDSSREAINHVDSIRDQYRERIEFHTNGLRALCRQQQWHYTLHRTDRDVADTLSDIWAEMSHDILEAGGIV
jgi:uncharacterized protein (DUF58 family)